MDSFFNSNIPTPGQSFLAGQDFKRKQQQSRDEEEATKYRNQLVQLGIQEKEQQLMGRAAQSLLSMPYGADRNNAIARVGQQFQQLGMDVSGLPELLKADQQRQEAALHGMASLLGNTKSPLSNFKRTQDGGMAGFNNQTNAFERVNSGDIRFADSSPKTEVILNNGGSFKIPEGFMLNDPSDPSKGVTPIPGGPKDSITGENAGKTQMLRTAQKAFQGVRKLAFDKDGSPNYANIGAAQMNIPGSKGRQLRNRMEFGIQAITRLETGAAMPANELENTRERFQPSIVDDQEIIETKLQMFEDFISGTLKLIDPSGRFDADRFQTELEKRTFSGEKQPPAQVQGQTATNPQTGEKIMFNPATGQWERAR